MSKTLVSWMSGVSRIVDDDNEGCSRTARVQTAVHTPAFKRFSSSPTLLAFLTPSSSIPGGGIPPSLCCLRARPFRRSDKKRFRGVSEVSILFGAWSLVLVRLNCVYSPCQNFHSHNFHSPSRFTILSVFSFFLALRRICLQPVIA